MTDVNTTRPKFPTELVARIANGILIVLGVFALARAFVLTEVEVGQVGVRYNNALGLQKEDLQPGYHLELVGMQRIWRLPAHFLVLDFAEQDVLSIRTKDNNTVTVEVAVPYRIKHGEAWRIMDAGNHLPDGEGRFRFQRFAEQTATDVLRGHLAQLRSEDFYNTDRRLEVSGMALNALNEKLAAYHLEANTVLIRAAYFRPEYETQLAQIQLNEQQKLLDGAKQAVATKQQSLDNFTQQTNALAAAKEQDWGKRIAQLDRAYQVGLVDTGDDRSPGAARRKLEAMSADARAELVKQAAELFGMQEDRVTDGHLLGIKNIEGETMEYSQRIVAEADAVSARLSAEGEAKIARIKGAYEGRVNQLLNSPAGRAYVGYNAADKVNFASELTFQSKDGIPSVLRLGDFAKRFIGQP
jgi:regulator of protease activity HflC (stomatin/prohibitin superfamily)